MPRSVPEWTARHDDQAIPTRVKLRVADRQRPEPDAHPICPICTMPIVDGDGADADHVIPLKDGGKHAESNLCIVHRRCHRMKTAREAHDRAEAHAKQKRLLGFRQSKRKWPSRPMNGGWTPNVKQLHGDVE